jgi:spore coat protein A, manganese oxidase
MKRYNSSRRNGMLWSRREFLQASAAGGAALLLPWGVSTRSAHAGESPTLTKFKDPLPIPGVMQANLSGVYHVRMRQFKHELHSDLGAVTTVWGFGNGASGFSTPGPTFVVRAEDATRVVWYNNLSRDIAARHFLRMDQSVLDYVHGATDNRKAVVHLHGGHVSSFADGYPHASILPTQSVTYDYAPQDRSATLWYHDHAIGNTARNVYMGLAGGFLVRDAQERAWIAGGQLPDPRYEAPLVLQDRRISDSGRLAYPRYHDDTFFGDVMLVNGRAWPHLDVEPRKYRFRLLNGSNTRNYTLQLGSDSDSWVFQQIGTDGGFLPAPLSLRRITLTPGERADVIVDFAQPGMGSGVVLMNRDMDQMHMEAPLIEEVMEFRVGGAAVSDDVTLPTTLASIVPLNTAGAAQRYFELEDEYDPNVGDGMWHITGPTRSDTEHRFEIPTHTVQNGSIEVWNWVNKSDMIHPMHIHLVQFQVLGRWQLGEDDDGNPIGTGPNRVDENEKGWKDTVRVGPLELVSVAARFSGVANLGAGQTEPFPFHCHVLEHEDHEMMRQYLLRY